MSARALAAALLALGVALAAAGCGQGTQAQQGARPNIVVIMTDDQTLESMRVMDGTRAALGAAGTTFQQAIVSSALCCPSRATLFTGQYPHNHGVLGNRPPEGGYGRLDTSEWLPLWLQRAGYHTLHIGKFLNRYGQDNPPSEVPPGWDEWYASVDRSTYQFYGYQLNENGVVSPYGRYSTDEYTDRAVDAVARLAPSARPFFLSLAYLAPHAGGPRDPDDPAGLGSPSPAERHRDRFAFEPLPRSPAFSEADVSDKPGFIRRRSRLSAARTAAIEENYRQELESLLAVDEGVVALVEALRVSGELDNTLIVFTSDNGFFHGEHRVPYGKVMVYEPSIRVPLIMRGPGVPAGERRRQLVSNADLAPTLLEAAGAAPALPQDGRSLFGLLRDRDLRWGRELLIEGPSGLPGGGLQRPSQRALPLRRARQRRARALRPAARPAPAREPPPRPALLRHPGPPGRAAGRASDLLGIELPLAAARAARAERLPGLGPGRRASPACACAAAACGCGRAWRRATAGSSRSTAGCPQDVGACRADPVADLGRRQPLAVEPQVHAVQAGERLLERLRLAHQSLEPRPARRLARRDPRAQGRGRRLQADQQMVLGAERGQQLLAVGGGLHHLGHQQQLAIGVRLAPAAQVLGAPGEVGPGIGPGQLVHVAAGVGQLVVHQRVAERHQRAGLAGARRAADDHGEDGITRSSCAAAGRPSSSRRTSRRYSTSARLVAIWKSAQLSCSPSSTPAAISSSTRSSISATRRSSSSHWLLVIR